MGAADARRARAGRGGAGGAGAARARRIAPSAAASSSSGVGAEVRELGLERSGVRSHTPARFFFPASVRSELAAVREREPEHRLLRPLLARPAGTAGGRRSSGGRGARARRRPWGRAGSCPAAVLPVERAALERARRRVERLQRRDVPGPRTLDRRAGDERVELAHPRLDLGQLGHVVSVVPRRSVVDRLRRRGADRRRGDARRRRRGAPPRARGRRSGRRGRARRRRSRARHVPALVGEADPGAAGRAGAARPRRRAGRARSARRTGRRRSSSRACGASSPTRPATEDDLECGPEPTRIEHNCSGQARRLPGALPRAGLADEGLPPAGHPCQQEMLRESPPRRSVDPGLVTRDRDRRLRRADVRAVARAARRTRSRAWRRSTAATASSARCARTPSSSAVPSPPT